MADIFISYAHGDRDTIEKLAGALEARGYSVWWDREIAAGSEFSMVIEQELQAADVVVVAWSERSLGSHWVRDEADFARGQGKLLPLSLDGSLPPLGFRQIHAVNFHGWDGGPSHRAIDELASSIGGSRSVPNGAASVRQVSPTSASIAVLPFANMSSDPEQEYFSDGMAEEVLNALANVPGLLVAGRTSSFAFKGKNVDIREIGRVLNVGNVLEGSVRKQGERVRITAQLVRASDGFHLWSEKYDGTLDDVFDLQDQISLAIVGKLETLLGRGTDQRLAEKLTDNKEAYDLFLRARALLNKYWGDDTVSRALELLQAAVELDPGFLKAWELTAFAQAQVPQIITVPDEHGYYEAAARAATRALEIDPQSLTAKHVIAYSQWDGTDFVGYYEKTSETIESNPESVFAKAYKSMAIGRFSAGLPHVLDALDLEPLSGRISYCAGQCYLGLSEFELAEAMFHRAQEAGFAGSVFYSAEIKAMQGEPDLAFNMIMQNYEAVGERFASQLRSKEQWEVLFRARYFDDPQAQDLVETFILNAARTKSQPINYPMLSGLVCERSAESYFRLYLEHRSPANWISLVSEAWMPWNRAREFRMHPGFKDFAEKIGLVAAWQKYGWPDLARPDPGTDGSNGSWTID
ncbi:TIR domain-containing protein [Qipengyuania sp. 1XM1-15A]|uniref:TIR domain-containing protein n=1 Tax=Qipengyuania xiamenensis TaxID=2867237 RepID=UPI001C87D672|nr:TIR domain-containing protein [Qipengyuania xiamenensis]MBX7532085.1 TIR domain-containing protein [Qipengyuania xiamenensis]